ncbi:MAG TPA: peptidylprolyl isomerase [Bryobacteraceae bacterium]|nr:peptidylprolyl isomerase [Bryobacteraceae bacterium]
MFNLFRSRDKLVRYFLGGLLLIVAGSMVTYLIPGFNTTTGTPSAVAFEIGDTKYTVQEIQTDFNRLVQAQHMSADNADIYFPQFVDNMIQSRAAVYEANRLGLGATDDQVLTAMMQSYPQFFPNGVFQKDQYEAYLAQQGATVQEALDDMRGQIALRTLQDSLLGSVIVSPKEVEEEFTHKYDKAKVQYIAFPPAKFKDQVKVGDDDVRKEWERTKNLHVIPQKFNYQVLVVEQDKVEASIQVTDEQLRAAYSANMDNFRTPDRVHVRHILIGTKGKSDAEKKSLLAKAQDVLKQVKAGGDFAELAKKYSEDPGTAQSGGDLGFIAHGQTFPEFDKTIFELKPKEISGIVTTDLGYHIIQALEKESARVKPFEEAKATLIDGVRKQSVTEKMQSLVEQARAELTKSPRDGAEIAKKLGIELVSVPKGSPTEPIPTLGVAPEIGGPLAEMKPGDVSQVVALPANRLAVFTVLETFAARAADFDDIKGEIKDTLTSQQVAQVAIKKAQEVADRLRKGEDIQKVAKSLNLDVTTSSDFGRTDAVEGLGEAVYLQDAFSAPVGTILGPTFIQNRMVVSKVIAKTPANLAALPAERASLLAEVKRKKAGDVNELLMDSIVNELQNQGKVKVYRKEIQQMLASNRR